MKLQLKEIRKNRKLSQSDLAGSIGANIRTVGSWERGETMMNVEQLCRCCDALGCTPNELTGWYIEHPEDAPQAPSLSDDEGGIVEAYRSLTASRRVAAREMIAGLASGSQAQEAGSGRYEEGAA